MLTVITIIIRCSRAHSFYRYDSGKSPYPELALSRVVIYEGLYFDLAQDQMNGAPNETRTHSCRFASLTC